MLKEQTTILFKIDKTLKKRAQATAKELGIPLSLVFKTQLTKFVSEKKIEIGAPLKLNQKAERRIEKILKDFKENKNISESVSVDDFLENI